MFLLPAGRIKEGPRHVLPETLDGMWVLADQPAGALLQHLLGPTLADSSYSGVRLDGNYQVALIKKRVGIRRQVDANTSNFHLGNSRLRSRSGRDAHAG